MKIKNVGFIGLGAMGSVMAPLIVSAGYHVFGYDIHTKICLLYTSPSPRD